MAMGWVVRLHVLLFLAALADIAFVGQAERPESFKSAKHATKHSHRKPKTKAEVTDDEFADSDSGDDNEYNPAKRSKKKEAPTHKSNAALDEDVVTGDDTDVDSGDDSGDEQEDSLVATGGENASGLETGDTGSEDASPEDEAELVSEPCLESEGEATTDAQCTKWSEYGCEWKERHQDSWCVHKNSKRYKTRKPDLEAIFANEERLGADEDEDDDASKEIEEVAPLRSKALSPPEQAHPRDSIEDPLPTGNDSQMAPAFKPDQDFSGEHYLHTKEVGIKVGQLVRDAHHQIHKEGGLHTHADEAKYKSDKYHHTLQAFESDLQAYKTGVTHFRQTAADAHHEKTENLKAELIKAPHAKIQVNQDIVHEALRTSKPHA